EVAARSRRGGDPDIARQEVTAMDGKLLMAAALLVTNVASLLHPTDEHDASPAASSAESHPPHAPEESAVTAPPTPTGGGGSGGTTGAAQPQPGPQVYMPEFTSSPDPRSPFWIPGRREL